MSAIHHPPLVDGDRRRIIARKPLLNRHPMALVTTKDGVRISYKGLGTESASRSSIHHGWPLCADDWDTQMPAFAAQGDIA